VVDVIRNEWNLHIHESKQEREREERDKEEERAQREREGCDDNFGVQHRAENPEKPLKEHLHFTRHGLALLRSSQDLLGEATRHGQRAEQAYWCASVAAHRAWVTAAEDEPGKNRGFQ